MKTVLSKKDIDVWKEERIKEEEIIKYMDDKNRDFINEEKIFEKLKENRNPDREKVKNILQKSLSIQTLSPFHSKASRRNSSTESVKPSSK